MRCKYCIIMYVLNNVRTVNITQMVIAMVHHIILFLNQFKKLKTEKNDGIYFSLFPQWNTVIIMVEALHGSHVFCLSSHVIRNLNWKYTLLRFHILQIF